MYSYYDLLQLVKDGVEPKEIQVHMAGDSRLYVAEYDLDDTFNYYHLKDQDEGNDEFHWYLAENFLESCMFDDCICTVHGNAFKENALEKLSDDSTLPEIRQKINQIIELLHEIS